MSLLTYKMLHILGLAYLLAALGAITFHAAGGGNRDAPGRKMAGRLHGVSLVVMLVSGFGMLARLGVSGGFPLWVWGKLVLWLVMGGVIALPYRKPQFAKALWLLVPALVAIGGYLALYKP